MFQIMDFNIIKKSKFMGNLFFWKKREFQILKRKEKE